jgi:hypothetical protein
MEDPRLAFKYDSSPSLPFTPDELSRLFSALSLSSYYPRSKSRKHPITSL